MGTLNLESFRAELLFDLRNRTDTSGSDGLSTARQDSYINAGYLWATHPSVFRHRELQTSYTIPLVSGTSSYVFTPNAGVVMTALRYATHVAAATDDLTARRVKLLPQDEQWFQSRSHNTGAPRNFCVRGSSLILSPVPSANETGQVLAIGAWREPAVLIAGQTTVLSTLWDEIIVLAARWRAELHLGYRDLAETTKLDLTALVNEYRDFESLQGEDWDWAVEVRTESAMESA